MHIGQYIFMQIVSFLPKRFFERFVANSNDRTKKMDTFPLEPSAHSHVWTTYGLRRTQGTHRYNNRSCEEVVSSRIWEDTRQPKYT